MKRLLFGLLATTGLALGAAEFRPEPGFELIFNGRDLTGWGYRDQPTLEKQLALDGRTSSPDGRYLAKHGRIVVTTPPEGRRVEQLWTTRELDGNFVLKLEFRATPTADSAILLGVAVLGAWLAWSGVRTRAVETAWWQLLLLTAGVYGAAIVATGAAVAHAFHKVPGVRVIVLFPINEVSLSQRKLMTSLKDNVRTVAIDGKFDDCQAMVKRAFADPSLTATNAGSSALSVSTCSGTTVLRPGTSVALGDVRSCSLAVSTIATAPVAFTLSVTP